MVSNISDTENIFLKLINTESQQIDDTDEYTFKRIQLSQLSNKSTNDICTIGKHDIKFSIMSSNDLIIEDNLKLEFSKTITDLSFVDYPKLLNPIPYF